MRVSMNLFLAIAAATYASIAMSQTCSLFPTSEYGDIEITGVLVTPSATPGFLSVQAVGRILRTANVKPVYKLRLTTQAATGTTKTQTITTPEPSPQSGICNSCGGYQDYCRYSCNCGSGCGEWDGDSGQWCDHCVCFLSPDGAYASCRCESQFGPGVRCGKYAKFEDVAVEANTKFPLKFTVVADPDNEVQEDNECNNIGQTIVLAPVPPLPDDSRR